MDIRQLEYAIEVAKQGSYTKAADALFVSRQGLSKAVKNLEKETGALFSHSANGRIRTTDAGAELIQNATPIVADFRELASRFSSVEGKPSRHALSVAVAHGVMLSLPGDIVSAFQREHPDMLLSLEEVTTEAALDMADAGEADIALVGSTPRYLQDFDMLLVVKTGIYLHIPRSNALADHTGVSLRDLDKQPFVTTGKRNHLHRFFIEECTAAGVSPDVIFTTSDVSLLVEQAQRRQACYFGFPPSIQKKQSSSHVLLPVEIGRESWFGTYAVRRKGGRTSEAARAFWSYLMNRTAQAG